MEQMITLEASQRLTPVATVIGDLTSISEVWYERRTPEGPYCAKARWRCTCEAEVEKWISPLRAGHGTFCGDVRRHPERLAKKQMTSIANGKTRLKAARQPRDFRDQVVSLMGERCHVPFCSDPYVFSSGAYSKGGLQVEHSHERINGKGPVCVVAHPVVMACVGCIRGLAHRRCNRAVGYAEQAAWSGAAILTTEMFHYVHQRPLMTEQFGVFGPMAAIKEAA